MVTPLGPVHTNGTTTLSAPAGRPKAVWPPSGTKPAWWVGAAPPWLTQPLCATK